MPEQSGCDGRRIRRREFIAGAAAGAAGLGLAGTGLAGCASSSGKGSSGVTLGSGPPASLGDLPDYGIPAPTGYLRTNWSRDPFALCSYSALAPSHLGSKSRTIIAKPVKDRLWFTGEATSVDSPAYVHGALTSGQRTAASIASVAKSGSTVTIIGAGVSGMACGRELIDAGFDVQILEARDRTGGRVWTETLDGEPAEMGANWIAGVDNNPLTPIAKREGFELLPFNYDYGFPIHRQGVAGRAGIRQLNRALKGFDWSSGKANVTPVSHLLPRRRSPGLQWAVTYNIAQEYGVDPERLSVLATDEGLYERGGDALIRGSYQELVTRAAGKLPVRLNTVVKSVLYSHAGAQVVIGSKGETITSDYCVVTVPIGVLKAGRISFLPTLPREKFVAVDALGAGLLDKLWLSFDEVFWDPDAEMIHWIDPHRPGLWAEWINGHHLFGKPLLLGFNGGSQAHQMAKLDDQDVVASGMSALGAMFG